MKFFHTKKEPETKEQYPFELGIKVNDIYGGYCNIAVNAIEKMSLGKWSVYQNFIKWFYCRPQSKIFVFKYSDGETAFKRKHIKSYSTWRKPRKNI